MRHTSFIQGLLSLYVILFLILISYCKNETRIHLEDKNQDTLTLVKSNCGRCHDVPDPSSLDQKTWNHIVLKNMGCRLGIQTAGYNPFGNKDMVEQGLLQAAAIYPSEAMISEGDWKKILNYYMHRAPEKLDVEKDSSRELHLFKPYLKGDLIPTPRVTMLHFDSLSNELQVGMESGNVFSFSGKWKLKKQLNLGSTPIQFIPGRDTSYILSVGVLYPSEQKSGSLLQLTGADWVSVLTDLHRPVWMTKFDLNQDKILDFIISEYGYETGKLSWYDPTIKYNNRGNKLYSGPGAIKTRIIDLDGDHKEELVALVAQGKEQVLAYIIDNKGQFVEKNILHFPAIFGVCDMDIIDFNGDQLPDIIISNGDNADYSQINKPYHGIHIYINQGNFLFTESEFIPYPGVLHSEVDDFDRDGDLDIAAVSFFPGDSLNPYPAFKYFEQIKPYRFTGSTFKTSNSGKWMSMAKGDLDRDGDVDLVLGSFLLNGNGVVGNREELKSHGLLFLENKLKSAKGNSEFRK